MPLQRGAAPKSSAPASSTAATSFYSLTNNTSFVKNNLAQLSKPIIVRFSATEFVQYLRHHKAIVHLQLLSRGLRKPFKGRLGPAAQTFIQGFRNSDYLPLVQVPDRYFPPQAAFKRPVFWKSTYHGIAPSSSRFIAALPLSAAGLPIRLLVAAQDASCVVTNIER